jgi:HlyD family secretion protein
MKKALIFIGVIAVIAVAVWLGMPGIMAVQSAPTAQPTLAPVKSTGAIVAEASVIPVQDTTLSFAASGVVGEVLVKEGQVVQAGQALARLNGTQSLQATLSGSELEILTAQQDLDSLKQGAALKRAQAQQAVADAQKALQDATNDRYAKNLARVSQATIDAAQADLIIDKDLLKTAQENYDKFVNRPETDLMRAQAFNMLAGAQQKVDQAQYQLNWLIGRPDTIEVAQADAKIVLAQARLADAQHQFDLLKDGPDPQQVALIAARLKNAQDKAAAAKASLANLELTAPFSGTVTSLNLKAGAFVQPGVEVAKLADFSTWLIKTKDLTELNVVQITPGMKATVKLDAIPETQLSGQVAYIEGYGQNRQSDIVYAVVLKLDAPDPRLHWNMSATVTFATK